MFKKLVAAYKEWRIVSGPIDRDIPGHNRHDFHCKYWFGDFKGVRLNAVCKECRGNG